MIHFLHFMSRCKYNARFSPSPSDLAGSCTSVIALWLHAAVHSEQPDVRETSGTAEHNNSQGKEHTATCHDIAKPNCNTRGEITTVLQTFTTNSLYTHPCEILSQLWILTTPMSIRSGASLTQSQQFHSHLFGACSSCCQLEGQSATIRDVSRDTSGPAQWVIRMWGLYTPNLQSHSQFPHSLH